MSGEAARTVRTALMASIAMSAFAFTSANAQEAVVAPLPASAAQEHTEGGLGDIVVTARRRAESLQDVPVAVTALTAEVLERYDMTSLEKISTQTPQFTIGRASNGSGAQLTLRGIGSSSTSIGIEQSVAVVVDGVYYGQGRVINEGFLDLEGVEVLKGPQSLFFGKNATAGVISLRTADPTSSPEFKAKLGYEFRAKELVGEFVGSGPITDTLGVRVAVRASNMWGGYFKNGGIDKTYNTFDVATGVTTPHFAPAYDGDNPGNKELLGRVTLVWDPGNDFKFTLKANGSTSKNNNNSWNYVPFGCATGTYSLNPAIKCGKSFTVYQNYFPEDLAGTNPWSRDDGALYNTYKSWAVTGTAEYAMDNVDLTWVNNFNRNVNQWACDCTFVSSDLAAAPSSERSIYHAFSSELRAQTRFDGPINLLVGAYYQKTHRNHRQSGSFGNIEDSTAPAEYRYLGYFKHSETHGETLSAYGQTTWKILPTLEAAVGVRYIHETKDSYLIQPYVNAALQGIFLQDTPINADQTFNNWSPEATLTWKPTDDVTVYGASKTAYKSGGFSNSGFVSASTVPSDVAFAPEKARGFEVGIKSKLLDNQLRLNFDVYSYKYVNLQVDFFNSQTFAFITTNAGAARTKGAELEFEFAPYAAPGLNLHGSINYNKARYLNYIAPCYGGQSVAQGCDTTFQGAPGQDLSGAPTAVAPKWTGSLGVGYETDIGEGTKLGATIDTRYSSTYLASSFAHPFSRQAKYLTVDGTIRVKFNDERFELALIGKNLTNQFIVGGAIDAPNTGTTGVADQIGFVNLPRTVQLQASVRF
ncbi:MULTISPECIES: TonB-dependent receptor [Novosphingobium]|uniref:TonB-dependent receptor n=1 Tax=Novosphingobium TaxID=165696 RepID=UPI0022F29901|nr:TonB-dependent receptor [Novosphingobium resinovorum]GLK44685.1 ligand-gated channel [Novosphingobium resinovorum]